MFSKNNKISLRQIRRLFDFDVLGISTLLLPGYLAKTCGMAGIFVLLFVIFIYIVLLSFFEKNEKLVTFFTSKGFYIILGLGSLLASGFILLVFQRVLAYELVERPFWFIGMTLLLVVVACLRKGIETRARIYEILYWFLMIPFLFFLIVSVKHIDVSFYQWEKIELVSLGRGFVFTIFIFWIYMYSIFLKEFAEKPEQVYDMGKKSLLFIGALNVIVYLVLIGVFGILGLQNLPYPIITLMSMVDLPGRFFYRQDAFMMAIWFFTLFSVLNTAIFYANEGVKKILNFKQNNKQMISLLSTAGLIFVISLVLPRYMSENISYTSVAKTQNIELEEKSFPMALIIGKEENQIAIGTVFEKPRDDKGGKSKEEPPKYFKGKTIKDAFSHMERNQSKVLDCHHVKLVFIQKNLIKEPEEKREILNYLLKEKRMAFATPIMCFDEHGIDFLKLEDTLEYNVGEYLVNVLEKNKVKQVNLGYLYISQYNKNQSLYIPVTKIQDGGDCVDAFDWYISNDFQKRIEKK